MRYGFGILNWTRKELRAADCKLRKLLHKGRFHHPKSNTHRLHMSRHRGGRGVIGVVDCHRQECTKLAEYIRKNTDDHLVQIVREVESKKAYGIMSFKRKGDSTTIDEEHEKGLRKMAMHGDYFRQQMETPNVDLELSHQWLKRSYLRFETESLICAAQEQALATRYTRQKIWKTGGSPKCRLCMEQNETVHHIVSGCKMLAGTKYLFRHNQVAKYIHWRLLKDRGFEVKESWIEHNPRETETLNGTTILWDVPLLTDKKVKCNRPDITIHDTINRECTLVDISIPVCGNIIRKEAEKIVKYKDLEIEIQKCWNLKKISTIPVIVGALGTVSKGIENHLNNLSPNAEFKVIQKTALLGTAHILRNFLKS